MAEYTYKTLGIPLDIENWEAVNNNFMTIARDLNNLSGDVLAGVIDDARLKWQEPVDSFTDLATTYPEAETGWTVFVRNSGTNGETYRFDGTDWLLIQEFDGTAINEVDNRLVSQLADTEKFVSPIASAFWQPPAQPTARSDEPNFFASGFSVTADQLINNLYEPLRLSEPQYITRVNKGKDQSGTFDWWRYEFVPQDYEKTIILGAGIHGTESGSALGLYLFLKELVTNWEQHPALAYVRNKVRLIVMPCENPWGLSQSPKLRQNSRGVDLNRNFDYKWTNYPASQPFDHDYKGTAAESEIETQYIKETLNTYNDAIAYIDFHNIVSDTANYVLYTPKAVDAPKHLYSKVIAHFHNAGETVKWGEMDNPTGFNYAAKTFGMNSANPEFGDGIWGRIYDAVEMTKYVEWYGNIIIQHAKLESKIAVEVVDDPFVVRGFFRHGIGTQINIPIDANYQELQDFRLSFDVPSEGILEVRGEIVLVPTASATSDTIIYVTPMVGQVLNKGTSVDFDPFTPKADMFEVYAQGNLRETIPFSAHIPVYPTSKDIGPALVGLYARSSVGLMYVGRYRVSATFIPSQKGERLRVFDSTGRGGQGIGAMQQSFPVSGRGYDV